MQSSFMTSRGCTRLPSYHWCSVPSVWRVLLLRWVITAHLKILFSVMDMISGCYVFQYLITVLGMNEFLKSVFFCGEQLVHVRLLHAVNCIWIGIYWYINILVRTRN